MKLKNILYTFICIVTFALCFQIVKADTITIDDMIDNFNHLAELKMVDMSNLDITKTSNQITFLFKDKNVKVNFNYEGDEITYKFEGDKTKSEDLRKSSEYDTKAINYLIESIIDLQGKGDFNSILKIWDNDNVSYEKNGIEISMFDVSYSDDEDDPIVGEFVDSVKVNINKLNLENLESDPDSIIVDASDESVSNNEDVKAENSNIKSPNTGLKENLVYVVIGVVALGLIVIGLKKYNKFIKIK